MYITKDKNIKVYRFVFDWPEPGVPVSGDIIKVTPEKMALCGLQPAYTLHGLKDVLSSKCPLIDSLMDESVPYVDLIEEIKEQPDGCYRVSRRFMSPSECTAEEESDDTEGLIPLVDEEPHASEDRLTYILPGGKTGTVNLAPFNGKMEGAILRCLNEGISPELITGVNKDGQPVYNWAQMVQVLAGLELKLTEAELDLFTDPELTAGQMQQIRLGLVRNGLGIRKVRRYAEKWMSEVRMEQARLAFAAMLPAEAIDRIVDRGVSDNTAREIRLMSQAMQRSSRESLGIIGQEEFTEAFM